MAENRYYWLKLKEDFFSSLRIKKLRKLAGGDTFTIIYLKMQLKAIRTGGILTFRGVESDFADELALDIDEDAENVRITLAYLISNDLVEQNGSDYMLPFASENIGSESAGAQRVSEFRKKQKLLQCNTDVTKVKQVGNGDIDRREKRKIEDIEKRVESYTNNTNNSIYGINHNVTLTDEEFEKLRKAYPDYENRINRLSIYMADTGKTYSSHYNTIVSWAEADRKKEPKPSNTKHFGNEREYDDDFFAKMERRDND